MKFNDRDTIYTYVLKTNENEFYCGKTNNIPRRMKEHKNPDKKSWFYFKNRKDFEIEFILKGDYEKNIKSFGVKKFVESTDAFICVEVSLS